MKSTALRFAIALLSFAMFVSPAQAAFVAAPAAATTSTSTTTSETALTNAAKEGWKSLSRAERKSRTNAVKDALKGMKDDPTTNQLLLVILAILLPPLAVFLHEGKLNSKFWLDLLLTLLFYVPGLIYALIVIFGKG